LPPLFLRLFHLFNHLDSLPLLACSPASGSEYWPPLATSHSPLTTAFLSPLFVTLADHLQLTENPATLSPFPATLTRRVKVNPFVCHSYKKHQGWGYTLPSKSPLDSRPLNTRESRPSRCGPIDFWPLFGFGRSPLVGRISGQATKCPQPASFKG
jgi:hypothetical protein